MKKQHIAPLALLATLSLLAGCSDKEGHAHPELKTGKELFEFHCAGCHHSAGNGNFLAGIPANKGTRLTNSQIVAFIRDAHREDSKMPAWEGMPDAEAQKIAAYVKSL